MKLKIDDCEIFSISEQEKKVIEDYYLFEDFDKEIKERINFVFLDIYNRCLSQLRKDWEEKLISRGHEMLPVRLEAFAKLVFSQADYRNKKQRIEAHETARRVAEQSTIKVI